MTVFPVKKGKALPLPFFCLSDFLIKIPALIIFFWVLIPAKAQTPPSLPVISSLNSRDTVFRQYISDVEAARRMIFISRPAEELVSFLTVYLYVPVDGDGLMAIAARCNIPYGTIVSLNRFSHAEDLAAGKPLLLSSIPGIFVPETPGSDLEELLISSREEAGILLHIPIEGRTERFRFFPGNDFSPTERIFFLNRGFRFPLRQFRVSSSYGPRVNPVTGKPGIHRGLDLAAPEGTEVYSVRSGVVADTGEDAILGKYIIVSHENNWTSIYGHLSAILVSPNAELQTGGLIARVGSTGQSTGPHLHFELRQNGQSRDPASMLPIFRGGQ